MCNKGENRIGNRKIRVAFIDDGINGKLYQVLGVNENISINKGHIESISEDVLNKDSHGSRCAAIFSKYVLCDVEIVSIKILHDGNGNCLDLLSAIDWCEKNHVDVINMSIGTVDPEDGQLISEYINYNCFMKNMIIVAAMSNNFQYTYPASLNGIIGVRAYFKSHGFFIQLSKEKVHNIEIEASSIHIVNKIDGGKKMLRGGNSYAVPVVSSYICNLINCYGVLEYEQILKHIENIDRK